MERNGYSVHELVCRISVTLDVSLQSFYNNLNTPNTYVSDCYTVRFAKELKCS